MAVDGAELVDRRALTPFIDLAKTGSTASVTRYTEYLCGRLCIKHLARKIVAHACNHCAAQ
jgi:hypothetical protein